MSHTALHMSPAQAAHITGVSRWTIMRAIKSHDLKAVRDNKNQWRISQEALDEWRSHNVHETVGVRSSHTHNDLSDLEKALTAERARADLAEALLIRERSALEELKTDRDRWRQMAEKLAEQPRKWWPWGNPKR